MNILLWYEACGMTRKFRTSSSRSAPILFRRDEGGMCPAANSSGANCRYGMHSWVWLVNKCNFSGSFTAMQQAAAFDRCTVRTCTVLCLDETQIVISRSRSTCTRNPKDFRIPLSDFIFSYLIFPLQALFLTMLSACRVHCVQRFLFAAHKVDRPCLCPRYELKIMCLVETTGARLFIP